MSEEEILEIVNDFLKINEIYSTNNCPVSYLSEYQKAIQDLLDLYYKQQKEIEELKKYDYRNIKISEDNKLSSIHFTKEQLDLMNLGIALYIGIPKMFKESEESDI